METRCKETRCGDVLPFGYERAAQLYSSKLRASGRNNRPCHCLLLLPPSPGLRLKRCRGSRGAGRIGLMPARAGHRQPARRSRCQAARRQLEPVSESSVSPSRRSLTSMGRVKWPARRAASVARRVPPAAGCPCCCTAGARLPPCSSQPVGAPGSSSVAPHSTPSGSIPGLARTPRPSGRPPRRSASPGGDDREVAQRPGRAGVHLASGSRLPRHRRGRRRHTA